MPILRINGRIYRTAANPNIKGYLFWIGTMDPGFSAWKRLGDIALKASAFSRAEVIAVGKGIARKRHKAIKITDRSGNFVWATGHRA